MKTLRKCFMKNNLIFLIAKNLPIPTTIKKNYFRLRLRLLKPMVCEPGQRFTLRLGDLTLGTGVITKINNNLSEEDRLKLLEGKKAREKAASKK